MLDNLREALARRLNPDVDVPDLTAEDFQPLRDFDWSDFLGYTGFQTDEITALKEDLDVVNLMDQINQKRKPGSKEVSFVPLTAQGCLLGKKVSIIQPKIIEVLKQCSALQDAKFVVDRKGKGHIKITFASTRTLTQNLGEQSLKTETDIGVVVDSVESMLEQEKGQKRAQQFRTAAGTINQHAKALTQAGREVDVSDLVDTLNFAAESLDKGRIKSSTFSPGAGTGVDLLTKSFVSHAQGVETSPDVEIDTNKLQESVNALQSGIAGNIREVAQTRVNSGEDAARLSLQQIG